jgi:hypothetical protein
MLIVLVDGAVVLRWQYHLPQSLAIRPQAFHCTTGDASQDDINGAARAHGTSLPNL